jgi:YbgC/YbaW family acyl-CoA thioester hydrolase
MVIAYTTKVQHENTDCYGIAHHSAYVKWVEMGRNEFFEQLGIKFSKLHDLSIKILVSEMECKFKKPVFLMSEIIIATNMIELKRHSITFEHIIKDQSDNSIVFKGTSKVISTDKNNKLLSSLPEYIYQKLLELKY